MTARVRRRSAGAMTPIVRDSRGRGSAGIPRSGGIRGRGRRRRTRPSRGRRAGGSRRPSSGRSRTSGSGAGRPPPRGRGRRRGDDLVDVAGDHQQPLAGQAVGVGQGVERGGQRLQVGPGPARLDPQGPDRASPGLGHVPEDRRQVAPGEQEGRAVDRRVDRRGQRRDDPAEADAGHAELGRVDLGPARQPGRRAADVADPLPHRADRPLDVGRQEPLRGPRPAGARRNTGA